MDSRDENDPTNHHDRAFPGISRRSIQQVAAMTRELVPAGLMALSLATSANYLATVIEIDATGS